MEKQSTEEGQAAQEGFATKSQRICRILLIVLCLVAFLQTAVINSLASGAGKSIGLYINSTGGVSDYYYVEVTPAGWAFSIWGLIYTFQIAMILYFVINIFRKTPHGTGVYYDPNFISVPFLIVYVANYAVNTAWIIMFDRSILYVVLLSVCAVFLWLILFCLIGAAVFSYRDLDREAPNLLRLNMKVDIWLVRVLAHNGISLYATWCAVASPLNTSFALAYVHQMSQTDACTVALSILAVEIVVYVSLDTFLLDRWTRYTISPHCVLVWALSASVNKNYVSGKRNSIFTAVLLAIAVAALIEKIILIIVRHIKKPMYTIAISDSSLKGDAESNTTPVKDKEPLA